MKTEKRHDFSNIKIAWWGWEDSNLQPNDYQPLALSIDQRPACGISWLRANSFKRKLYDALRAMEYAGFSPGITSGFRDDSKLFFVRIDPLPEDLTPLAPRCLWPRAVQVGARPARRATKVIVGGMWDPAWEKPQ
jgi:hypothetical protein